MLEWDGQRESLGATEAGDRARADWLVADSRGRNTMVFWTSAGSALTTLHGVQSDYQLGGFLNLSGLTQNSLAGPHFAIARLIYLRKISSGGEGLLEIPAYFGVSAEAGNVWAERHEISYASARKDGAAFLGLDTLLGPAYLGAGLDEGGHASYYLFLGRTF
jgi:NTE family protein